MLVRMLFESLRASRSYKAKADWDLQGLTHLSASSLPETAGLLPAKFWQRRRQGRKWDVRDNLFKRAQRLKAQANNNDVMHGYQADQPVNTSGRNE